MENKKVGSMLIGISIILAGIVFLFNSTLKEFIETSCTLAHGDAGTCPMFITLNQQTYLSLAIVGILFIFGLLLLFSKPHEKIIVRKIKEKQKPKVYNLKGLKKEEKAVFDVVKEEKAVFQADLIDKLNFGKAKMSRIIDRLEGRGLVERKRRGMNNIVALK